MIKRIKKNTLLVLCICLLAMVVGCTDNKTPKTPDSFKYADNYENIYQVFVRSYADSDGNGIGDFIGLKNKLAYIKELGFTAIWLMPINQSPSYHGYDVTDYYDVESDYGTLADFQEMLDEANDLGIDIYMDLVINHSSNQHEWFKKAVAGESPYVNYYVFGTNNASYWYNAGNGKKYYGYFSSSMPDLNLQNESLKQELFNVASFWANMGVSGFRLDGALHYYRSDEYNSGNATYALAVSFIEDLNYRMQEINPDFNIIVEAWDSYVNYASTFRSGASPIDFDLADLITDTATSVYSTKFNVSLERQFNEYALYDQDYVPVPFCKNHDMDRLASTAGFENQASLIKAAEILLTIPGSPIVYYGEELGMKGIRANGANNQYDETVRLPYVFNDEYQTSWTTDYQGYNNGIASVDAQLNNPSSLLNVYKYLLNLRNNNIALKYGNNVTAVETGSNRVVAFTRTATYNNKTQTVLVIYNLSNSAETMVNCSGTLLYATEDRVQSIENLTTIPGKTTLIIDITNGSLQ